MPLELEKHQTGVVGKAASHAAEGWAGRITFPGCAGTGARVAWSQFLRASSHPGYIPPCARNRGGVERALQGEHAPPQPPSGSPQPHVVRCLCRWLLP